MDAHNLAVVFGPTLFRIPSEQDMIAYQSQVNGMIELLIKHSGEVFPGSGESLREKLSDTEDGSDSEEGKNVEFLKKKKKKSLSLFVWKVHQGRFPFVRTDRPDHSRRNDNFTFNQNSPSRSDQTRELWSFRAAQN